jgi:hypothetical protein
VPVPYAARTLNGGRHLLAAALTAVARCACRCCRTRQPRSLATACARHAHCLLLAEEDEKERKGVRPKLRGEGRESTKMVTEREKLSFWVE